MFRVSPPTDDATNRTDCLDRGLLRKSVERGKEELGASRGPCRVLIFHFAERLGRPADRLMRTQTTLME